MLRTLESPLFWGLTADGELRRSVGAASSAIESDRGSRKFTSSRGGRTPPDVGVLSEDADAAG
jgi:hypothetical protein